MEFTLIDFFIGFFLMNAMPHLLFGLYNVRMISAFGLSPLANLIYSFVNVTVALVLFHLQYGMQSLASYGIILGAGTVVVLYLLTGRFFYNLLRKDKVVT